MIISQQDLPPSFLFKCYKEWAFSLGSAARGALSMFVFAIGTVPLMLAFDAISGLLSKGYIGFLHSNLIYTREYIVKTETTFKNFFVSLVKCFIKS